MSEEVTMEKGTELPGEVFYVGDEPGVSTPDYEMRGGGMFVNVDGVTVHLYRPYGDSDMLVVEAVMRGNAHEGGCPPLAEFRLDAANPGPCVCGKEGD